MMRLDETTCRTSDGLELPCVIWPAYGVVSGAAIEAGHGAGQGTGQGATDGAATDSRGTIAIFHGMGEHIARYERFAALANARGFSVVGADFRGHGKAPGEPCMVNRFDDYAYDAQAILLKASTMAPDKPLFLLGHSMGGAIALRFLFLYPEWRDALAGIVFSSAALKIGGDVSPLLLKLAPIVAAIAPKLRLQPIDPALISRDPKVVDAYISDPLVAHRPPPARTANGLLQAIAANRAVPPELTLPVYAFHGDADRLTAPEGTSELVANWKGADKTLRLWPGSYHETMNDLDAPVVMQELLDWLSSRA